MWSIEQLKYCKESEDKVEFKKGEHGNVAYDGGSRLKPSERRRCILGYVTALCNEKGGSLVIGMEDKYPHKVVGTRQNENSTGELEANIYRDTGIRPKYTNCMKMRPKERPCSSDRCSATTCRNSIQV